MNTMNSEKFQLPSPSMRRVGGPAIELELWGAPSFEVGRAGVLISYSRTTSTHVIDANQTGIFSWVKGKTAPGSANQEPRP
jgi:hypothetical protein